MIELAAITVKFGAGIKQPSELLLYPCDVLPYTESASETPLQIGCSRQMIGVNMRFEDPLNLGTELPDSFGEPIGAGMR